MKKQPDIYDATFFYSLCNLMADFMYDKWTFNRLNVRKVKYLSNQLKEELERSIDVLFDKAIDSDRSAVDQFINATQAMEEFFKLGLKMDELEDGKKEELQNKLNEIINQYLPNYETGGTQDSSGNS